MSGLFWMLGAILLVALGVYMFLVLLIRWIMAGQHDPFND